MVDIFDTALYHALLHPRTFSDSDGAYPRFAGGGAVEQGTSGIDYHDFSMWDTVRAQHPLLTIIDPALETDMGRSLILKEPQRGYLPISRCFGTAAKNA